MNAEKGKGWEIAALRLFKIPTRRADFAVAPATLRSPENCRRRVARRPGGTPQEISRGQARPSGRGPRLTRLTRHAPAGHRRSFWRGPPRNFSSTARRLGRIGPPVIGPHPGAFLRCPAGARSHLARFPGAASAGAALPPANILRCPSGTGTGRRDSFGARAVSARSGLASAKAREIPNAPAVMSPLRPGTGRAPLWLRPRFSVLQPSKILAEREDCSRSAAVCAAHQPQQVGRLGRLEFQRMPAGIRGRCGWSSADTAAVLG